MSEENTPTSSSIDEESICPICGKPTICGGLGWVRRELPYSHPDFGKMFRCPNNPPETDGDWQRRMRALSNLGAYADKTFDNFYYKINNYKEVERGSLEYARNTALAFAEKPHGWLLLEGPHGCGKTHLAAAIGNARLGQGDIVLFITTPDLLDHLRAAYGPSSEVGYDETFERIRNAPLLILDDLGVENPSPWAQEKLFQLLNHRYNQLLPTVLTTNLDAKQLDARLHSRLMDKEVAQTITIQAPDYRSHSIGPAQEPQANLMDYAEMTFENFDTLTNTTPTERKNLEKILQIARSYAQAPEGWLLLMGPYGSGKTHLAAAIALQQSQNRPREVMFITVPDLLDYLRVAYDPNTKARFDERFQAVRHVPLLVLDDLGTENATSWAKEKLFQILDYRYVAQLPTVITTAKELDDIDARIRSRLLDKRRCTRFAITARTHAIRQK